MIMYKIKRIQLYMKSKQLSLNIKKRENYKKTNITNYHYYL